MKILITSLLMSVALFASVDSKVALTEAEKKSIEKSMIADMHKIIEMKKLEKGGK